MKILITGAWGNRQDLFTQEDVEAYSQSPFRVLDMKYPGAKKIIEMYNFKLPSEIHVSDLSKEQQELGYKPKYNFGAFIQELIKEGVVL